MEYRTLGRTGMQVSTFALGTMVLGAWGNPDHDECERVVRTALDAGINVVDTADVYVFGESEEIVGAALAGRRDEVILATKFHNPMGEDVNSAATPGAGSCRPARPACAGSARTGSTSTRSTGRIRAPASTRPSVPSPTSSIRARSAPSARRPSPPGRSRTPRPWPPVAAGSGRRPSSLRTRCWSGGSSGGAPGLRGL